MIATTVMVLCGLIISHIPCGFGVPSQLPLTNEGAMATLPDEAVLTREELFDIRELGKINAYQLGLLPLYHVTMYMFH